MKTREKIAVAIAVLAVSGSLAVIGQAYFEGRHQRWNMTQATKHIAVVQPSIRIDARFQNVELLPYTGDNGCLLVQGYVDSQQALDDLRHLVDNSNPPVFTKFAVVAIPDKPNHK